MNLYKVARLKDGIHSVLWLNRKDGQYHFMPVNGQRFNKFEFVDAQAWVKHLSTYKRYADGSIRCVGGSDIYQIISCND